MTLRWVPGWNGLTEPEAVSYVAAVEAADGQELEFGVARAINDFVTGCKNDGIWDAIKDSCILAGARTVAGALVTLKGTPSPTNVGPFVLDDYDRKLGLLGNGTSKALVSSRRILDDPQDNCHLAYFPTFVTGSYPAGTDIAGGNFHIVDDRERCRANDVPGFGSAGANALRGASRSSSAGYVSRNNGTNRTRIVTSLTASDNGYFGIFGTATVSATMSRFNASRIAFYSIGESLDLEKLDNRVTRLMNLITYTQTAGLPDLATMDIDAAAYIGGGYRAGGTLS